MKHVVARPFLKWVGGKTQLLSKLLARAPARFNTYYEPFLGGGALYFALVARNQALRAHLSDSNARLMRAFQAVRDDVEAVIDLLHNLPNDRAFFLRKRAEDPDELDNVGCAAWMIYLNKTTFNGFYRVNASGGFNAPFGKYTNPRICDEVNLRACSRALQGTSLHVADFRVVARAATRGDFVYFDPPFVPTSRISNFTSYTAGGFEWSDQAELRDLALELKARGVHVMLSGAGNSQTRELYADGFEISIARARRNVNCRGTRRGAIEELILR